jgi:chromosome segregation ATPase
LLSPSRVSKPKSKTELTDVINESSSSSSPSVSYLSTPDQPSPFDSLKQQHDKLASENAEISSKFKLLEQIHLDTISEYDKQQAHLFNQIEDMHLKANKTEHEIDNLTKRLNQTKLSYDSSLVQINALNAQLSEYKETIHSQEKEITRLSAKIQQLSEAKDVKHLETRITDVLEKMKEREAVSNNEESLRIKCDKLQSQLQESQAKIAQLNTHIKQHERSTPKSVHLVDFSDDLGKVLMSKEEVITQLERQLKDKEKHIQTLTEQLSEEMAQTSKYQDALSSEMSRNTELSSELKSLNANLSEQYVCMDELDALKEQLAKSNLVVESLEFSFSQASLDKEKFESELKSLQEYSRNEIETLQEEVKTLEYKLVHSQRQAHEYQSLLEDMDLANSSSVSFLSQTLTSCGGSLSSNDSANTSLQSRLKRNQSCVQAIVQQIIELKNASIDELKSRSNQLQAELDEVREENVDLNDHIYSIDVFMREKEALCDQYQKERDDILARIKEKNAEIDELKSLSGKLALDEKKSSHASKYERFVNNLKDELLAKTSNLTDFVGYALSICSCLLKLHENQSLDGIDEPKLLDLLMSAAKPSSSSRGAEMSAFKASMKGEDKLVLIELKQSLKKLTDLIDSSELAKCNTQIVSYMAEQLVHKAALNGHLKVAFFCFYFTFY